MASIKEQVSQHMKEALKAGAKERLAYARNLHAAIRKREIDDRKDLEDAEILKIIGTLVKQRQESIEQFQKGNRPDLVANETAELEYLRALMPAQMPEAELRALIQKTIGGLGLKGPSSIGKAMQAVLPLVQGKADGKLINQLVREALGS